MNRENKNYRETKSERGGREYNTEAVHHLNSLIKRYSSQRQMSQLSSGKQSWTEENEYIYIYMSKVVLQKNYVNSLWKYVS